MQRPKGLLIADCWTKPIDFICKIGVRADMFCPSPVFQQFIKLNKEFVSYLLQMNFFPVVQNGPVLGLKSVRLHL